MQPNQPDFDPNQTPAPQPQPVVPQFDTPEPQPQTYDAPVAAPAASNPLDVASAAPIAPAPAVAAKKSNKTTLIILGALVAVLVIGGGAYLAITLISGSN